MKTGTMVGLATVAGLVCGAVAYASPYFAVAGIKRAVDARDVQAVAEYVDFAVLREDIKGKLLIKLSEQAKTDLKGNPFAVIGQAFAIGLVNQMADTLISPAGVMLMLEQGKPSPIAANQTAGVAPSASLSSEDRSYRVTYLNWSRVKIAPEGEVNGFIFRREGWFGWKLVALDLAEL